MKGEILTFYSIKMGVGRSMALASVAWILATNGKRVLIVDWDFDNPSLHRFFTTSQSNAERLDSTPGLIDLCWELMLAARAPQETPILDVNSRIIASILPAHITSIGYGFSASGKLDIMRAGQPGRRFNARVRYFSWSDFYDRLQGTEILNVIFGWMADAYDYVLVDSPGRRINSSLQFPIVRTDRLILCFTLDGDSIEATAKVARFIQSRMGSALRIYPVPMRLENAERQKLDLRRSQARHLFAPYLAHLPEGSKERYWAEVEIPEISYYKDEHEVPPRRESADDPKSLTDSYERLISYLTDALVTQLVPLKERTTTEQTTEAYQKSVSDDEGIEPEAYSGPYEGEGGYSFVSYSRGDVDMVMPIVQDISDLGYHLWWDEGIPGATDWLRHLEEKIKQSKYLLLFLSRRAVESKYVRAEIEFAQQNRKPILAIRLDLTALPQPIEELLGKYQMLDVSAVAFEENLGRTLRLLDAQTAPTGD